MSLFYLGGSGKILSRYLAMQTNREFVTLGRDRTNMCYFDLLSMTTKDIECRLGRAFSDFDRFFIFSAISSPDACAQNQTLSRTINCEATSRLIAELLERGVKVVFASSDAVYEACEGIADELTGRSPLHAYGNQKAFIEDRFSDHENFHTIRFSYVLFEDDFILSGLRKGLTVGAFDNFFRNAVAFEDVCEVLNYFADEVDLYKSLNCVGPENLSKFQIANSVQKIFKTGVVERQIADNDFFANRVGNIRTKSLFMADVLGRESRTVEEWLRGYT